MPGHGGPDGEMVVEEPMHRRRRTTSRKSKHKEKSTATSGNATASAHPSLNTDDMLSFNNPSSDDYPPDMDDNLDSLSPLENHSSEANLSLIDPALRGTSVAAGKDASDAVNDELRPHDSLASPLFELRSMSANSPSHESLAPYTQGFQFRNGGAWTTPTGSPPRLRRPPHEAPLQRLQRL
ncbi:hypothetical protein B0H14DRAFT_3474820 [Mycena olivaceomarginata]|nr:hypothetical protein B0H14DRAFT_3474820 [Mycena olivaceomarginata]